MSSVASLSAVFRPLRRKPGFALAVVFTLALGIAPNCVIFAILDAVYFRPLPYPDQDRLVLLNVARKDAAALAAADAYSFSEWQRRTASFQALAAYRNAGLNIRAGSRPARVAGQLVTGDFFAALGSAPALGRGISASDCLPGAPPVVVISHQAWKDVFDGRPDIVNLPVRLNGTPGTIVGVMPEAFTSFMEGRPARAWAPLTVEPSPAPGGPEANVVGRLKPGVTIQAAQAVLSAAQSALVQAYPEALRDRRVVVRDFRSSLFGGLGPGLRMLTVIVGLLLLIACANAANLLLGMASARTRDVALRTAIGASRRQLVGGQLAESLLLAAAAAACGLLLAFWGTRFVWSSAAPLFTRIGVNGFPFGWRVVVFATGLTALATALFGLGPAIRGSRGNLVEVLKPGAPASGRDRRAGRLARTLVVAQVTLCVVTLVVTALMVRSFVHFSRLSSNPGFDARGLTVATLPGPEGARQPGARLVALREVEGRVAAEPGVELVAVTSRLPFLEPGAPSSISLAADASGARVRFDAELRAVNAAYFTAMSVDVVRGRGITMQDDAGSPAVAVIDERLAGAVWGTADPVGRQLFVDGAARTVVGVVRVKTQPSPFQAPSREVFVPFAQADAGEATLLVRSRLSADAAAGAVRRAVAAVDPEQPLTALQPLSSALDDFMTPFRLILSLIVLFGVTALGLAALGLYSVVSRGVAQRTKEIGIRMAMGASRREIILMVMREGLRPAVVGLSLGVLLGMAIAKVLPSAILGVTGLPASHYLAAVSVWLAAAAAASAVPARRAAAIEPVAALRCE